MIQSILFFGNYPNPVSPTLNVFFQNLIYKIADMGIKCTVIDPVSITKYKWNIKRIPKKREETTPNGGIVTVLSPRTISVTSRKIGFLDLHVVSVALARRAAIKEAKKLKGNFDATYGHFINVAGVVACHIGHEYGKPCFVANGESDLNPKTYNYDSPYKINDFRYCTGVISVSRKNANELIALNLIDDQLIQVFPNGVNHSIFYKRDKREARKQFGFKEDDVIAIFVGSFSNRKGHKRVLEAAETIEGLKLVFVGEGDVIQPNKNILFCGKVEHNQLPALLSASDFFVLPTLNEGCCNAILEALACGLPVISSNMSFNDEALTELNSIRVNPMSIEEIRAAMNLLFQDNALREKLSNGALDSAQKFDINKRAEHIIDFINSKCL